MGYMAQNQQIESSRTIYEEMLSVFEKILTAEVRLREIENEMTHLSGKELSDMMEDYASLQHEFEQNDGYSYKSRLKGVLKGLGFGEDEFDRPLSQLSRRTENPCVSGQTAVIQAGFAAAGRTYQPSGHCFH